MSKKKISNDEILQVALQLIDENGIIVKAMDKVKAADNPQQMLEAL